MEVQDRGIPTVFVIPLLQYIVGALLFVSLLYGQRELVILTIMVFGMLGGTKLWTRLSLKNLNCRMMVDKVRMFPDEKLSLRVNAENKKFLPAWLQLKIPVSHTLHPSGETELINKSSLLWHQRARFQWQMTARQRGVHRIGPLQIFTGDLFEFFSRGKKAAESFEIIVYPRIVPLKTFTLPRHDFFGSPGSNSPVHDPVYILGTRDYQHGQPSKYIHWKASARYNRLQEKVFGPTKQEKLLIAVDVEQFARRRARKDFERALEAAASLAVQLDRNGHAVGLVTNGRITGGLSPIVQITRNHRQLPAILETLARIEMSSQGELIEIMRSGLDLNWGVSCVHFCYESNDESVNAEGYFKRRKTPVIFFASRLSSASEEGRHHRLREIHSLEEIYSPETEKT
jgi:uncharacterized protein (DUF58 family)